MNEELKAGRQHSLNFELSSGQPYAQLHDDLIKAPTVEKYRKIMARDYWTYSCRTIKYLREYEAGLQGVEYLLRLTELFKNELDQIEAKVNKWRLRSFYLELLDKMDRWEDYLKAVEILKKNPEGQEMLSPPDKIRFSSGGWDYKNELEAEKSGFLSQIEKRNSLIQKKIALQKAGKSVKRYLHKRLDQLTDEEYQRRTKVLKFWFEFPKKWEEWAKAVVKEGMKAGWEQGPKKGGLWTSVVIEIKEQDKMLDEPSNPNDYEA